MSDASAGLSRRLLTELTERTEPLPKGIPMTRVRALRRQDLVKLVQQVAEEESARLRAREEELERRELATQQRVLELEEELGSAREELERLAETQKSTARYELPRLAGLVDEERSRADEALRRLTQLESERDALAHKLATAARPGAPDPVRSSADADALDELAEAAAQLMRPRRQRGGEALGAPSSSSGSDTGSALLEDAASAFLAQQQEDEVPVQRASDEPPLEDEEPLLEDELEDEEPLLEDELEEPLLEGALEDEDEQPLREDQLEHEEIDALDPSGEEERFFEQERDEVGGRYFDAPDEASTETDELDAGTRTSDADPVLDTAAILTGGEPGRPSHTMALEAAAARLIAGESGGRRRLDDDEHADRADALLDAGDEDAARAEALLDAGDADASRAGMLLAQAGFASRAAVQAAREEGSEEGARLDPDAVTRGYESRVLTLDEVPTQRYEDLGREPPGRRPKGAAAKDDEEPTTRGYGYGDAPRAPAKARQPDELARLRAALATREAELVERELELERLRTQREEHLVALDPRLVGRDLDELLASYAASEERAARIDILEEVVWQLEAGRPSSEAWRRAVDRLRRACAQEQAAREEAVRLLHDGEARRLALEDEARRLREEVRHHRLELDALIVRYGSQASALEDARRELLTARRSLSEADELADSASQAWSQAEDELEVVGRTADAQERAALLRTREELRAALELQDRLRGELERAQAARDEALGELAQAHGQRAEAEAELESADLALQETELELARARRDLAALERRLEVAERERGVGTEAGPVAGPALEEVAFEEAALGVGAPAGGAGAVDDVAALAPAAEAADLSALLEAAAEAVAGHDPVLDTVAREVASELSHDPDDSLPALPPAATVAGARRRGILPPTILAPTVFEARGEDLDEAEDEPVAGAESEELLTLPELPPGPATGLPDPNRFDEEAAEASTWLERDGLERDGLERDGAPRGVEELEAELARARAELSQARAALAAPGALLAARRAELEADHASAAAAAASRSELEASRLGELERELHEAREALAEAEEATTSLREQLAQALGGGGGDERLVEDYRQAREAFHAAREEAGALRAELADVRAALFESREAEAALEVAYAAREAVLEARLAERLAGRLAGLGGASPAAEGEGGAASASGAEGEGGGRLTELAYDPGHEPGHDREYETARFSDDLELAAATELRDDDSDELAGAHDVLGALRTALAIGEGDFDPALAQAALRESEDVLQRLEESLLRLYPEGAAALEAASDEDATAGWDLEAALARAEEAEARAAQLGEELRASQKVSRGEVAPEQLEAAQARALDAEARAERLAGELHDSQAAARSDLERLQAARARAAEAEARAERLAEELAPDLEELQAARARAAEAEARAERLAEELRASQAAAGGEVAAPDDQARLGAELEAVRARAAEAEARAGRLAEELRASQVVARDELAAPDDQGQLGAQLEAARTRAAEAEARAERLAEELLASRAGEAAGADQELALGAARARAAEAEGIAERLRQDLRAARGRADDAEGAARALRALVEQREDEAEQARARGEALLEELEAARLVLREQERGLRARDEQAAQGARALADERARVHELLDELEGAGERLADQDRVRAELVRASQALAAREADQERLRDRLEQALAVATAKEEALAGAQAELSERRTELDELRTELERAREATGAAAARDGLLAARYEELAARNQLLSERDEQLAARDAALVEKDEQLAERDAELAGRDELLAERDAELRARDEVVAEREQVLAERDQELAERDAELGTARADLEALEAELAQRDEELTAVRVAADAAARERDELRGALAAAEERSAGLRSDPELADAAARAAALAAQVQTLETTRARLAAELEQARASAAGAAEHAEELRQRLADQEDRLLAQEQVIATLGAEKHRLEAAYAELSAQLEGMVSAQLEDGPGDEEAAQELAQAKSETRKLASVLSAAKSVQAGLEQRMALLLDERDALVLERDALREELEELEARGSGPSTDLLAHPDLPAEAAAVAEAYADAEELSSLRLLLSEQEALAQALRAELVELRRTADLQATGLQASGAPAREEAPPSDAELVARLEAIDEELSARERRVIALEREKQRLSEEVYDLGRLLESECWRGLATHRDLVKAQQRLREVEEGGLSQVASAAQERLAEVRRELTEQASAAPGDVDHQQSVAWLLSASPQKNEFLREVDGLLASIEAEARSVRDELSSAREDFQAERKSLLEDLLTSERALRRAEEVGVPSEELSRKTRRATNRLSEFDGHLQVELTILEEEAQTLGDTRRWLLWEVGDFGGKGSAPDATAQADRGAAAALRSELEELKRRNDEEVRQRRQLERDAMQAMEDLERERTRLEDQLRTRVATDEELAVVRLRLEDRVEQLERELEDGPGMLRRLEDPQFRKQAERIAVLTWDLEARDSLVHWLLQELDPDVQDLRAQAAERCAEAIRALPLGAEAVEDPTELLHWLEAAGVGGGNGNGGNGH